VILIITTKYEQTKVNLYAKSPLINATVFDVFKSVLVLDTSVALPLVGLSTYEEMLR
jgi:hypothetical protein